MMEEEGSLEEAPFMMGGSATPPDEAASVGVPAAAGGILTNGSRVSSVSDEKVPPALPPPPLPPPLAAEEEDLFAALDEAPFAVTTETETETPTPPLPLFLNDDSASPSLPVMTPAFVPVPIKSTVSLPPSYDVVPPAPTVIHNTNITEEDFRLFDDPVEEADADLFGPVSSTQPSKLSLNASSLLFGDDTEPSTTNGGGGGLFDEVDAAQEQQDLKRELEEQAREEARLEQIRQALLQQEEQQRLAAVAAAAAAAAQQQQQQQQQAAMLLQPSPSQAQMHDLSLSTASMSTSFPNQTNTITTQQRQQDVGFYRPAASAVVPQQQQQQQQQPTQPPPPVPPVNAGYGGGSYYYSTSGSHQVSAGPTTTTSSTASGAATSNSNSNSNSNNRPYSEDARLMHGRYHTTPAIQHPAATPTATSPSLTAGLHNGHDVRLGGVNGPRPTTTNTSSGLTPLYPKGPIPTLQVESVYGKITVTDPVMVQSGGLMLLGGQPHWTYLVHIQKLPNDARVERSGGMNVRRRFQHFCALEARLREAHMGTILPPRPDKHPTLMEGSGDSQMQTPQFAAQRAFELQSYLMALATHPILAHSEVLKLFLALQDHIGNAWPEVSSNLVTRFGSIGVGAAVKVAEGMDTVAAGMSQQLGSSAEQVGEDNAHLLALASSEGLRLGSVMQAIPKMEGAIALLQKQGEQAALLGMDLGKLVKDVQTTDEELVAPLDILGHTLLRTGRRTKRLSAELAAASTCFLQEYKLCKYERMAFLDRRDALSKRQQARLKADSRAHKLMMHQGSLQQMGKFDLLARLEMEASMSDEQAVQAVAECDLVGDTLQTEVARTALIRRNAFAKSIQILASSMKEACSERAAIWDSAHQTFSSQFSDTQPTLDLLTTTYTNNHHTTTTTTMEGTTTVVSDPSDEYPF